jgi:hypothetical protein
MFIILKRTERDMIKHMYWTSCKVTIIPAIFFMKIEFSQKIFEKLSNIENHKNASCGSRVVPCGRTDRHEA